MALNSPFIQQPTTSGQPTTKPKPYTGSLFTVKANPTPGGGLLTSSTLEPNTTQSSQFDPTKIGVGYAERQKAQKASDFKAKYGFDMPGSKTIGVRAVSETDNIKAPTSILPKSQVRTSLAPPSDTSHYLSGTNIIGTPQEVASSQTRPQTTGLTYAPVGDTQGTSTLNSTSGGTSTTPGVANQPYTVNSGLYGQLITGLANKSNAPSDGYLAQLAEANKYNEALKTSRINEAQGLAANAMNPIPLEFQQGRAQVMQSQYAQEQAALGAGYQGASNLVGQANTQQGLQQSGLASAAGLAQPVGQFGMLTNPMTGQPLNTGVFQTAVQQAAQLVQNGADPQGQAVQGLLSQFGFIGQSAFTQAMQAMQSGKYNPSAQSAIVNQNISQGVDSQGQAYQLNLGLQQLKTLQPVIQNFLQSSGINPTDSPLYNQPINSYIAKLGNPAAATQYQYLMNDLQKFASQMLAAGGGGTPTGTQAATDLMDPSKLSLNQIQYALNTLDTLGTNQIAVLQSQSAQSLGGQAGYAGNAATLSNSTPVSPPGTAHGAGISSPGGQAAAGVGLNIGSWALGQAKNIGGEIMGFIGGKLL